MNIYYHTSPSENRESILRKGLLPPNDSGIKTTSAVNHCECKYIYMFSWEAYWGMFRNEIARDRLRQGVKFPMKFDLWKVVTDGSTSPDPLLSKCAVRTEIPISQDRVELLDSYCLSDQEFVGYMNWLESEECPFNRVKQ